MHARRLTLERASSRDECGASTAEYAVGTVAATGFAALLYWIYPLIDALLRACLSVAASSAGFIPKRLL